MRLEKGAVGDLIIISELSRPKALGNLDDPSEELNKTNVFPDLSASWYF